MKKYDYTKSDLSSKYQLVTEGALLVLRKEMFKEECWDAASDRPIPECWTESGEIKKECWDTGPGMTSAQPGYGGTGEMGELGEEAKPTHQAKMLEHLHHLEECANGWAATGHEAAPLALEAIHHLKEFVQECSY